MNPYAKIDYEYQKKLDDDAKYNSRVENFFEEYWSDYFFFEKEHDAFCSIHNIEDEIPDHMMNDLRQYILHYGDWNKAYNKYLQSF